MIMTGKDKHFLLFYLSHPYPRANEATLGDMGKKITLIHKELKLIVA